MVSNNSDLSLKYTTVEKFGGFYFFCSHFFQKKSTDPNLLNANVVFFFSRSFCQ